MSEIPKEYLLLFNAITDAEQTLAQLRQTLLEAQQQAEEIYMGIPSEPPLIGEKR